MTTRQHLLSIALGCAVTAAASAQCFNTNIGTALGAGDDTVSANNALGFTFPWPDGTTSTAIDIDSNGRIFQPGAATSGYYPDPYEFTGGATSIAPFWTDLDPSDALSDDVYFFTDNATTAVITWQDVIVKYDTQPLTFQVVMRSDGSVRFSYDNRMARTYYYYGQPIVGVSAGSSGAYTYGGNANLSDSLTTPFDSGTDPLVFENFYAYGGFDLDGLGFDFASNGTGGYLVIGQDCGFARATSVGRSCFPPAVAQDWISDSTGGYLVVPSTNGFSNVAGTSLGLGDDDTSTQTLGFSFTMPGGNVVTSVDIDSNGRILEGGNGASDFSPSVLELLNDPSSSICALWTDLNPNAGGDVTFFTDNAGLAVINWVDVPQFGLTNAVSVQVQLRAPDSWTIVYSDLSSADINNADFLSGASQGRMAADPGESDLTMTPVLSNGNPTIYELFTYGEALDVAGAAPLALVPVAPPAIGGSFDLSLVEIPASTVQAAVFLGTTNPMLNLGLVFPGLPCSLMSDNMFGTLNLSASGWAPGMSTANLSISLASAGSALIGLPLVAQGVIVDPTVPWAAALPIATSNAVEAVVGN